MVLVAVGVFLVVVGGTILADEWRRAGSQHARLNKHGLRVELVALAALCVGVGMAMGYAGVAA